MDRYRQIAFRILSFVPLACGGVVASQAFSFAWPRRLADGQTQDYVAQHALLLGLVGIASVAIGLMLTLRMDSSSNTKDRVESPGADGG